VNPRHITWLPYLACQAPLLINLSVTLFTARSARATMSSTSPRVTTSGGSEAEDVTVRHGTSDQSLFQAGCGNHRTDLEVGVEVLALATIAGELQSGEQADATNLADQRVLGESLLHALLQVGTGIPGIASEVLALDDIQVGDGRRDAHGVPGIGVTVANGTVGIGALLQYLPDSLTDYHPGQRLVGRGQPLATVIRSGFIS